MRKVHLAIPKDPVISAVRDEMSRRSWNISNLSTASGVPRTDLSRWLGGRRGLRSQKLTKVLAALHMKVKA